jgi:hypothetical protein
MKWKVDLIASLPHYKAHMDPIWDALPEQRKGTVHSFLGRRPEEENRVALVASWQDLDPLRNVCPMIYVEHGAGQAYAGDEKTALQPGYSASGGKRHIGVIGFISPSETVARRWTTAPAIAVGCPKIDKWRGHTPMFGNGVCFAFHWPCPISPETRSAVAHYQDHLPEIVDRFTQQGFVVYGHAHPKWNGQIDEMLTDAGMTVAAYEETVFALANILIMDNSSLMYEWASLDRPVIALNAPWYRRDVNHGLRFWDYVPGIAIDEPEELLALDLGEFVRSDPGESARRRAANHAYAFDDGSSAQRAADFIVRQLERLES